MLHNKRWWVASFSERLWDIQIDLYYEVSKVWPWLNGSALFQETLVMVIWPVHPLSVQHFILIKMHSQRSSDPVCRTMNWYLPVYRDPCMKGKYPQNKMQQSQYLQIDLLKSQISLCKILLQMLLRSLSSWPFLLFYNKEILSSTY